MRDASLSQSRLPGHRHWHRPLTDRLSSLEPYSSIVGCRPKLCSHGARPAKRSTRKSIRHRVATIPAEEAFRPLSQSECALLKS